MDALNCYNLYAHCSLLQVVIGVGFKVPKTASLTGYDWSTRVTYIQTHWASAVSLPSSPINRPSHCS